MSYDRELVDRFLRETRAAVHEEITRLISERRETGYGPLYDLLADYPFREGKGLRPAICRAACRAAGGTHDQAILSAAALELFHNAFLVHDDVEDGSHFRRGGPTLFRLHGMPAAVNVGDATNVLALGALLENTEVLGVRKTLLVFREVERMSRESVEGQAIELSWIRDGRFDLEERDYVRMAYKKTCWYTVIAPLRVGTLCGSPPGPDGPGAEELVPLIELGHYAGIAFQISDDLLNLVGEEEVYGKEIGGDLWEGKRTVMLIHFLRNATDEDRERALEILRTPRSEKEPEEVEWLLEAMHRTGSIEHGRRLSEEYSRRALAVDREKIDFFRTNEDRRFLREILHYVIDRVR